jgi:hypothetical protein
MGFITLSPVIPLTKCDSRKHTCKNFKFCKVSQVIHITQCENLKNMSQANCCRLSFYKVQQFSIYGKLSSLKGAKIVV